MNILYLISYAGKAGTEKYVENLMRTYSAQGHRCFLAYMDGGELAEKAKVPEGEPFYEIILANKDGERIESLDYTYIPCSLIKDIAPSLDYLQTHFVFDYLKAQPNVMPKFLKIFVNTPQYDFLKSANTLLGDVDHMNIWCTDVYDANMVLLGTTFTTYPGSSQDIPLFTFSLS